MWKVVKIDVVDAGDESDLCQSDVSLGQNLDRLPSLPSLDKVGFELPRLHDIRLKVSTRNELESPFAN